MQETQKVDKADVTSHLRPPHLGVHPLFYPAWPSSSSSASPLPVSPAGWPAAFPSIAPSYCAALLSEEANLRYLSLSFTSHQ